MLLKIEIMKQLIIAMTALVSLLSAHSVSIKQPIFGAAIAPVSIESMLIGKTQLEKADIKSAEIVKNNFIGIYENLTKGVKIEIRSVVRIEDGIEIVARAWKGTQQLGFGKDQTIEWQRFRIHNPPILTNDPNGSIIRERTTQTGELSQRKLREDSKTAIQNVLADTINDFGSRSPVVVKGSEGHTIDVYWPDPGSPGTNTVDGYAAYDSTQAIWSTVHDSAGNGSSATGATMECVQIFAGTATDNWRILNRCIFLFNTGPTIPAADTISSSTVTFYSFATKTDGGTAITPDMNIYASTPASNTTISNGDYAQVGTTAWSTAISYASFNDNGSNVFILNSTGVTAIAKGTGVTKMGMRNANYDVANTPPTWSSGSNHYLQVNMADTAGTDTDPRLAVDHSSAETGGKGLKIIIVN